MPWMRWSSEEEADRMINDFFFPQEPPELVQEVVPPRKTRIALSTLRGLIVGCLFWLQPALVGGVETASWSVVATLVSLGYFSFSDAVRRCAR